ncbi:MAG: hypothetical protein AVO38_06920 [delta proteobacterium ML8_D]|nr:MAG: hypothetical protein AVO38_06920 [delta proteobacterium ML8_D]
MEGMRRRSQYLFTLLANAYWLFLWKSPIYQGPLKKICFPGLNCHSCPAATMSCPLGALQNLLAALRPGLQMGQLHIGAYVLGSLGLVGSVTGRMPCGWICPFGLLQEWLFLLPVPKISLWRPLRRGPYLFLVVFVVLLPLLIADLTGYGFPWFCKYICPAGTLEAGIPLLSLDHGLRSAVSWLFAFKVIILILLLTWCVFTSRAFCRAVCPLGAVYGLFNRVSWLQLRFHPDRCVQCRACLKVCPTGVSFYNGRDGINSESCIRCLRCLSICPANAVSIEFSPIRKDIGEAIVTTGS